MTKTLISDLKTKNGEIFKAGTLFELEFQQEPPYNLICEDGEGRIIKIKSENAHKYFKGFNEPPTLTEIEEMSFRGVGETISGEEVAPDEFGMDNSPSWNLILGFI